MTSRVSARIDLTIAAAPRRTGRRVAPAEKGVAPPLVTGEAKRAAVRLQQNRVRPPALPTKTNSECQIKFKANTI
jgi:hypothetical protein